jgi:serine/threonine-protein kinase
MSVIGQAANTQELRALTLESLKKMENAGANVSGHLLKLGGSGSGSGVVSNYPPAATQTQSGRAGTLVPLALAAFFGVAFLVVLAVLYRQQTGGQPTTTGTATGAPSVSAEPAKTDTTPTTPTQTMTSATIPTTTQPTTTLATNAQTTPLPTRTGRPTPTATTPKSAAAAAAVPTKPPPPGPAEDPGFLSLDTYPYSKCTVGGSTRGTPIVKMPLSPGPHSVTCENPDTGKKGTWTVVIKSVEVTPKRYSLE